MQQHPLAILAYGSLLYRPGPELSAVIVGRVACRTPFPVEYARASQRWGGGPVLTPHPAGGPVDGQLLLLADAVELGPALDMLADREGLPDSRGIVQVADCAAGTGRTVLTAALPRNLPAPDMTPGALAERAIASVAGGERNGIAYLRGAIGAGVDTPRTRAYSRAVLEVCGARDLSEAERLVA